MQKYRLKRSLWSDSKSVKYSCCPAGLSPSYISLQTLSPPPEAHSPRTQSAMRGQLETAARLDLTFSGSQAGPMSSPGGTWPSALPRSAPQTSRRKTLSRAEPTLQARRNE